MKLEMQRTHGTPKLIFVIVVAVLLMLLMVGNVGGVGSAFGSDGLSGCPRLSSKDYSAPMRGFPPVERVPKEGAFPFGPPKMMVSSISGPIQAGRGVMGFRLSLFRRPPLRHRLGWQISLRVSSLSAHGVERGTFAERRVALRPSQETGREDVQVSAAVSGRPGFYRLDIAIKSALGATLGHYSEYVRVVVPTLDARLVLGGKQFHPGDGLLGRIQNRGTLSVAYMLDEMKLEQRSRSGWKTIPREVAPVLALAGSISSGAVGPCRGLRLPATLDAGVYRVSQLIWTRQSSFPLRAVFHVY